MRALWVLLSTRWRGSLQYRAVALAGAGTQFFWGFVMIVVYRAFYASSTGEPPMALADLVTYVWLGQALLVLLPWNHDREIEALIRRGDVVYELLRPIDLYALWFVRVLAMRTAQASMRALPIVAFAGVLLPGLGVAGWTLEPPPSLEAFAAFVAALVAGVALGCAITTLVHVSLLFTLSGDGVARLMPGVVTLFSGMVIPLPLFPDWAQPFLQALPFRALVDTPFRLYCGDIPAGGAPALIGQTLVWIAVFAIAGRTLLARATRRVVVQGG